MRRSVRGVAVLALVLTSALVALPVAGATASEFYLGMLQKGVTAYDAGRFAAAVGPLRIAAFGLIDSVPHYQTAQIYLALANDRLANEEPARDAAKRVVSAERVEARYAALSLPAAARSAFETVAKKVLTPADFAVLGNAKANPNPPRATPAATNTTNTPPPASIKPEPAPVKTTPQPQPVKTEPAPVKVDPPAPRPQTTQPQTTTSQTTTSQTTTTKPATTTPPRPAPATTTTTTAPTRPPVNVPAQFTAGEQALTAARLADARTIYRELLDVTALQRGDLLRVAEGLYRARDFAHALRAFDRLGALRRGEEPYRYYIAVALYETGQYSRAKQELTAVLPFIEVTPDVARYRTKIEGAVQ